MADPSTDPLALIIGGGGAAIGGLCTLLLMVVSSGVKQMRSEIHVLTKAIMGDGAGAVGLVTRVAQVEKETLTQTDRLDELRVDQDATSTDVKHINLKIAARPWSTGSMAAVRPERSERRDDRVEPESPLPPRPRMPSRPK